MRRFVAEYRDFLRLPDVATLTLVALVARMPVGMVGLSMLLFLREHLGSYALAGGVSGIYFVAMAIGAPLQGRLIDRTGPALTLWVTGLANPLALAAILAAGLQGLPYAAIATAAAFAGFFAPPITVLTRTLWRHRFADEATRRRAFALDAVMMEINFTVGPALVAAVVSVAHPTAAFVLSLAVVVLAQAVFAFSPALRYFKREPHAERHMLGPLTDARLLVVFLATLGLTTGFGLLEVGYPGYATALAMPALGGVLLSVNSLGSAIGGAVFGGLRIRAPVERQFALALGTMALPFLAHAAVDGPWAFGIAAFLAGACIAPAITCQSVLVSRLAPAKYATEAFTWSSTFIVTGLGAGMALGGLLTETAGPKAPFVAGAAILAAMALIASLLRHAPGRGP